MKKFSPSRVKCCILLTQKNFATTVYIGILQELWGLSPFLYLKYRTVQHSYAHPTVTRRLRWENYTFALPITIPPRTSPDEWFLGMFDLKALNISGVKPSDPLNRFQALALGADTPGCGSDRWSIITEESKVRNNCDNYGVSIMMNVKGAKITEPLLNTSLFR